MAVAITATEQDVYPPRVLVSVTGLTVGNSVELFRVVGSERTAVRAGSDDAVADTSFLRVDAEIPFGLPVSYVAVVNGSTEYTTTSATHTLTNGLPVLTDAISGLSAEAIILAWDEKRYTRQSSVFRVGGRNVVVADDWGQFEGTVEFFTVATSSRDNVMEVLTEATEGVVQVRQPGGYDGVDSYLSVTGAGERRHSQDGSDQRRVISADVVEVDGWAPALEARGYTLQDIADAYPYSATTVKEWTFASTTESWAIQSSGGALARVATPSQVGDGSLRFTPDGINSPDVVSPLTALPGSLIAYTTSATVYALEGIAGGMSMQIAMQWYDASSASISTSSTGVLYMPAATWTTLVVGATAPANATQCKVMIRYFGTVPTASNLLYTDWAKLEQVTGQSLNDLSGAYATLLDIAQADLS